MADNEYVETSLGVLPNDLRGWTRWALDTPEIDARRGVWASLEKGIEELRGAQALLSQLTATDRQAIMADAMQTYADAVNDLAGHPAHPRAGLEGHAARGRGLRGVASRLPSGGQVLDWLVCAAAERLRRTEPDHVRHHGGDGPRRDGRAGRTGGVVAVGVCLRRGVGLRRLGLTAVQRSWYRSRMTQTSLTGQDKQSHHGSPSPTFGGRIKVTTALARSTEASR